MENQYVAAQHRWQRFRCGKFLLFSGAAYGTSYPAGRKTTVVRDFIWKGVITIVQVIVRDNNVDQALRALKKKMQREGLFREMKLRRHYEKPSVKKAREKSEAVRRYRKLERKRKERDGE